jgi:phosphoglycolate/pyridoxal phosphate phosphatase family enzyme
VLEQAGTAKRAQLLAGADAFVFDCDGVLWKGDAALPQAAETVAYLRAQGKLVFFMTNNSTRSRASLLEKFHKLGIAAEAHEVLSSAYAAALLLQRGGPLQLAPGTQAYVVGEEGICDELRMAGVPFCGGPEDSGRVVAAIPAAAATVTATATAAVVTADKEVPRVPKVGAVVVGLDRALSYWKLQRAQLCLQDPSVSFVATNRDATAHLSPGTLWAGAGACVGAVAAASGRLPQVAGKPSSVLLDCLLARHPLLRRDRRVMVGDRLDTDMAFGSTHGLQTLLTLSGVTSAEQLQRGLEAGLEAASARVDYVCLSVAALLPPP